MSKLIICIVAVWAFGFHIQQATAYSQDIKFTCFVNPRKEDLERCSINGTCRGVGTYATDKSEKRATELALSLCNKEYNSICELDYCERK